MSDIVGPEDFARRRREHEERRKLAESEADITSGHPSQAGRRLAAEIIRLIPNEEQSPPPAVSNSFNRIVYKSIRGVISTRENTNQPTEQTEQKNETSSDYSPTSTLRETLLLDSKTLQGISNKLAAEYQTAYIPLFELADDSAPARQQIAVVSHVRSSAEVRTRKWLGSITQSIAEKSSDSGQLLDDYPNWQNTVQSLAERARTSVDRTAAADVIQRLSDTPPSTYTNVIQPHRYAAWLATEATIDFYHEYASSLDRLIFAGTDEELRAAMVDVDQRRLIEATHSQAGQRPNKISAGILIDMAGAATPYRETEALDYQNRLLAEANQREL